jgi:hypothetical protein
VEKDTGIFDERDRQDLAARGIPVAEAERQLGLLRHPPDPPHLERACTVGDGIERIAPAEQERLVALADRNRAAGRWTRFVPASGAATRMFQDLTLALALTPASSDEGGDFVTEPIPPATAHALEEFLAALPRFAFSPALEQILERRGTPLADLLADRSIRPILAALLEPEGLGYGGLPKALVPFHTTGWGPRTAFEEQLVEALPLVTGDDRRARFHFTVPAAYESRFTSDLAAIRAALGADAPELEVRFSHQAPSTDTLAAEPDGSPARDANGALLFRPAGHGALLPNLQQSGADRVFVKNIDNVAIDWAKPAGRWWAAVLAGRAEQLAVENAIHRERVEHGDPGAVAGAVAYAREQFGIAPGPGTDEHAGVIALLDRPLRVCGMVPNTGEPGGGPFWVRDRSGHTSLQIVESAQVDPRSAQQRTVFMSGTHFNPVFLACMLRDLRGAPYDLEQFVDPDAVIVTRKAALGRERTVIERPGLWNGSMAHWLTVFVEVPGEVFSPVKTVLDLLRPEHQPQG